MKLKSLSMVAFPSFLIIVASMIIYMVVGKVNHLLLKLEGTAAVDCTADSADIAAAVVVAEQVAEAVAVLPRAFPYYQQKSQSHIA